MLIVKLTYNTLEFLDDLKKEANKLTHDIIITNEIMSDLLTNQLGRHYENKRTLVNRYKKKGKIYLITKGVLKSIR